jgi:uncharacterized protein YjiS (DUF1127 family)
MTHLTKSLSLLSKYIYSMLSWIDELSYNIKRSRNVAETINELSKLSDAELKDIGISRGEIYEIAHQTYTKNSTFKRGWA